MTSRYSCRTFNLALPSLICPSKASPFPPLLAAALPLFFACLVFPASAFPTRSSIFCATLQMPTPRDMAMKVAVCRMALYGLIVIGFNQVNKSETSGVVGPVSGGGDESVM